MAACISCFGKIARIAVTTRRILIGTIVAPPFAPGHQHQKLRLDLRTLFHDLLLSHCRESHHPRAYERCC